MSSYYIVAAADTPDARFNACTSTRRRLLDAQLLRCIEDGTVLDLGAGRNPVLEAMRALLANDGLSS